jgi:F420-dependent oxidoreductase-like protein
MRICLMIEGQEDVSWDEWRALAAACEEHGIEALFRSDHYLSVEGRGERGSLDAWTTLAALAAVTSRVRLGTLVSPATFRHPAVLAKSAVTVDQVSGGRVEVGIGTGWLEAEHAAYGFPFPPMGERMEMLEEQVEHVMRQWEDGPFSLEGRHYRASELDALPKPVQRPHPPLIVGGRGGPRSTALAARWASEYNTPFATAEVGRERRRALDRACERQGREADTLELSLMTGCLIGADRDDLLARAGRLAHRGGEDTDPQAFLSGLSDAWVAGTVEEAAGRLRELGDAGVERVMLQHLLHDDLDAVALMGRELAPAVA